jgi:hypothetical protein
MTNTRLAALDFRADVRRLTEDFTGREWLFEEIDDWLLHHTDPRFFILTSEPGAGKSAIAARLTQIRPDNIAAYHFCIAGNVGTITPNTVLRSLAAQLGEYLPKYGEALANTIKPHQVSVNVKQEIGKVKAGAKVVGVIINHLTAGNPEEALDILFRAPLTELTPPDTSIFILIDSLDEAMTYQGQINLITLLAKTNDLPQWVRFVCTTRPEQRVLSYFRQFNPYLLAAESPQNRADISQYISYRMSKETMKARVNAANIAPEDLASRIAGLADGNFLYTKVVLNDIEAGQQPLDNLATLPQSLDEIYHGFLRRFSDKDWDEFYQPLLGKLAVAQEPLLEAQLAVFTDLRRRQVRRSLAVVGQYLDQVADGQGNETYRLFHQSLRDYLLDEDRSALFWCDPKEEHEIIARYYLQTYTDHWDQSDDYGLKHIVDHVLEAQFAKDRLELALQRIFTTNFMNVRAKREGWHMPVVQDLQKLKEKKPEAVAIPCLQVIRGPKPNSLVTQAVLRLLVELPPELLVVRPRSQLDAEVNKAVVALSSPAAEAVPKLKSLLANVRNVRVRGIIVLALGETKSPLTIPTLLETLARVKTREDHISWCAADALIALNESSTVDKLIALFQDPLIKPGVKQRILYILGRMPVAGGRLPVEKARELIEEGLQLRGNSKGRAIDLIWLLMPEDDDERQGWVKHYEKILYQKLGFNKGEVAQDKTPIWRDEWLQKRLVTALGRIGSQEAVKHLKRFAEITQQRPKPKSRTLQRKRNELKQSIQRAIRDLQRQS